MTLELKRTNWGMEVQRDVLAVNARLLDDGEYIQFVRSAIPGLARETIFSEVAEHDLVVALLYFAADEIARALSDGRIPLKDPTHAYEVRVEPDGYQSLRTFIAKAPGLSPESAPVRVDSEPLHNLELSSIRLSKLELRNLYSFGPHRGHEATSIEFESDATVLIGPNGAGKSNILFAIRFITDQMLGRSASPRDTPRFIGATASSNTDARIHVKDATGLAATCESQFDDSGALVQQRLMVGGRELASADYRNWTGSVRWLTNEQSGGAYLTEESDAQRGASMYSVIDVDRAHPNIATIYHYLEEVRVYREWQTGRGTKSGIRTDARFTRHLNPDLSNLSGVLSRLITNGSLRERLYSEVGQILPAFERIEIERLEFDTWFAVINGRQIPSDSLSDGTLQYLTLVALLLDPDATGPLLLDEPDLLLHPDAVLRLARLIEEVCSDRQVVVTTHNASLLDVIADDHPERVRVVQYSDSGTQARQLDAGALESWLDEFTVGEAWGRGAFGGNP
jgi:predicted ATPase